MAEKFYSVVAETEGGARKVLPVRGETPGGVFQQVKGMPDVRRVGKVTEISPAAYNDLVNGRQPHPEADAPQARTTPELAPAEGQRSLVGHTISGPRIVIPARQHGGEQPFKHLKPPPDRPDRPARPELPRPPRPVPVNRPALRRPEPESPAAGEPAEPTAPAGPSELTTAGQESPREYRIVKSRRRDGLPYLLQRGQWRDLTGKRVFEVDWEKGFDDRDKAEEHLGWLQQTEQDLAEVAEYHADQPA